MSRLPHPDALAAPSAPISRQPWRLELDDSLIPPEHRTQEMTAILEVTAYTPIELHLVLHWLQCLEMELILTPFCTNLLPATLTQVLQQAFGGRLIDRTSETHIIDLYRHWEGGFRRTVWPALTDAPYSTAALILQMQQRGLAPEGLGELLLEGLAREAQRGWVIETPAYLQHRREWEAYFALCGDTLTTWTYLLHRAQTVDDAPTCNFLRSVPWHEVWLGRTAAGSPHTSTGARGT